jgi:Lar family restriction alleviation protein
MPNDKLKGCPFCGREKPRVFQPYLAEVFYVFCDNDDCVAHGPDGNTKDEAISAWNKRVKEGEG